MLSLLPCLLYYKCVIRERQVVDWGGEEKLLESGVIEPNESGMTKMEILYFAVLIFGGFCGYTFVISQFFLDMDN